MVAQTIHEAPEGISQGLTDDGVLFHSAAQQSFDSGDPAAFLYVVLHLIIKLDRFHARDPDLEVEAGIGFRAQVLAREGIDLGGFGEHHDSLVTLRLQEMQGDLGKAKEILGGKGYGVAFCRKQISQGNGR